MSLDKEVKLLAKPYYWVNILLAFSYLLAKKLSFTCGYLFQHREEMCELDSRETEIMFFLLIVIMIRSRKTGSVTMVNYLSSSFIYTKVANLILWAYGDFRYGIAYLFLVVLVGMMLSEPSYTGPELVTYFCNSTIFEEELLRDKNTNWLICLYTVWSPSCVHFAPIFAELSAEYNFKTLKFGKVDIGRFSDIAKKYQISDSSFSQQLPTLILFKNGKEIDRRPCLDNKGRVQKFFFSADNVRASFGLNNLYKDCIQQQRPAITDDVDRAKKTD